MTKKGGAPQLDAWRRSAAWRDIARRQCQKMNRARALKPKCHAMSKTTGEPCRQPAMANGCCRFHGGRTPKGDAWGMPRWADKSDPRGMDKAHRKLQDRDRAAIKRAKRIAAMTPEEKAAYDRHMLARKPGPAAHRKAKREEQKHNAALAARLARPAAPPSPEAQRLTNTIAELEARLAQLQRRQSKGVFD